MISASTHYRYGVNSLVQRLRKWVLRVTSRGRRYRRSFADSHLARLEPHRLKLRKKLKREVNTVYARSLTEDAVVGPAHSAFSVIPANGDNLARVKAAYPKELTDRKYGILCSRVQDPAEDVWLTVDDRDEICGFGCLAWKDHEIKLMGHRVKVHPHQALFMDAYVFRKHRRRGAHTASITGRMAVAAQQGRTEGLVLIRTGNVGSTTSFVNLGFHPIGKLIHLKGFKRTLEVRRPSALRSRRS